MSDPALLQLDFSLMYFPILFFSYWRISVRLTSTSRWLARVMLTAQVLITGLSLGFRPESAYIQWLLHIGAEGNIPSVHASVQLALIGCLALVSAWHTFPRRSWRFCNFVIAGLVFLLLGLEEYLSWKSYEQNLQDWYAIAGAVIVGTTVVAAVRSPDRARLWPLCFLTGLSLFAFGGFVIDHSGSFCRAMGDLGVAKCTRFGSHEELLELTGSWFALLAVLGWFSETVPKPSARVRRSLFAFLIIWILLLTHYSLFLNLEVRLRANEAWTEFDGGATLYGYRLDRSDGAYDVRLYAYGKHGAHYGSGFAIHLVDQATGESVASSNEYAFHENEWPFIPEIAYVYRQPVRVELPPKAAGNRALWIVLALWRERDDQFEPRTIVTSDLQLLSDKQVILGEVVIPSTSPLPSTSAPAAVFDNGFRLGAVELPESAQAGESLAITFVWSADAAGSEDYAQFLHFGHEESGKWWVYDQEPLGPRLPTRLWYTGLVDDETWETPLPADLAPGRYRVFTGLYRQNDGERVPASEQNGTPFVDSRVPLGYILVER